MLRVCVCVCCLECDQHFYADSKERSMSFPRKCVCRTRCVAEWASKCIHCSRTGRWLSLAFIFHTLSSLDLSYMVLSVLCAGLSFSARPSPAWSDQFWPSAAHLSNLLSGPGSVRGFFGLACFADFMLARFSLSFLDLESGSQKATLVVFLVVISSL